jgi:16S rRNA (cytosine967-C5)-methyltransferase
MDRIPARAAIDESVELAKQSGHRFASAMVNAVLRKLTAPLKAESSHEPSADLASGEAHPAWMVERWISFYGLDTARAICRHGQIQPQLAIRLASNDAEAELNEAGVSAGTGRLVASARIVTAGDVASTSAFREGRIRMQDEGSQLVAEVAAANLTVASGRILDACAAPGGKTLILAERHPQALIVACDSSPARLEQMRKRLSAQAGRIEFRQADASELTDDAAFDLVLTDVPCSGTGTLGRNPEIRHRLRPQDISRQAERQRAILTAALRAVRSGGRVVYSTCSLEPEENEQVIAAVRAANPNVQAIPLHASIELLQSASVLLPASAEQLKAAITPEGALRLFPEMFNTDGFFMAILERGK